MIQTMRMVNSSARLSMLFNLQFILNGNIFQQNIAIGNVGPKEGRWWQLGCEAGKHVPAADEMAARHALNLGHASASV